MGATKDIGGVSLPNHVTNLKITPDCKQLFMTDTSGRLMSIDVKKRKVKKDFGLVANDWIVSFLKSQPLINYKISILKKVIHQKKEHLF